MKPGLRALCLFLSWLILSTGIQAQDSIQLIDSNRTHSITPNLSVFREQGGPLTLAQMMARQNEFVRQLNHNASYGFSERGIWLHSRLNNVTDTQSWVIVIGFSQLDEVDFYLLDGKNLLAQSRQGKNRASQDYRFPTFDVTIPFATTVDLYVRISSTHNVIAPFDIQSKQAHTRHHFLDTLLWGLFYGGLLILAIYNFVLYLSSRDVSLLTYIGYIGTVLLWQLAWGGHFKLLFSFEHLLWPEQNLDFILILVALASGLFTFTFLNSPITAPKTTPTLKASLLLLLMTMLLSLLNLLPPFWQFGLVYLVSLGAYSSYVIAGFESSRNRFRPAHYFILAWAILALCSVVSILRTYSLLPSNLITTYCFQVGLFMQVCLFAISLMMKSRGMLEQEIQQAADDLRNNMEFIEEQNARLDIARKNAIKASHVKSQFLANMSHEIRTPLNAILGFSKELNDAPLPVEKQEQVRIINESADTLLHVVNDVLDVSKIEAGKLQINRCAFSPNQMLEEVVSVMAKSAHKKHLEFIFDLNPLPNKLIGDMGRIKQILNNLLSNALKFTPEGHISLSAKGRVDDNEKYELVLKVEDTGIGISQQDRKKLFTAFSQVDDALSRSYQGTGLGLMICRQLSNLMDGHISLTSTPGQGSCFCVNLPAKILDEYSPMSLQSAWRDKHVVLYDPYPFTRRTTSAMLGKIGAQVSSADSLAFLRQIITSADLVLITLPATRAASRDKIVSVLPELEAKKLVLLYSGVPPLKQTVKPNSPACAQVPMPLTLGKLANLHQAPLESAQSELQNRLMAMPHARVLAVDDMEMNLRLLKTWLKPSPLALTLAFGGADAVELCRQQEFDLILMDVQMPNMDGLQASKLIRQTDLNLGTPIIALTAYAFKEEQERLLTSGMDDYLTKPLDLSALLDLINRWCRQQEDQPLSPPSVDWDLALRRANFNDKAAQELLQEFSIQLPGLLKQIKDHWQAQDLLPMQQAIHKLHGACCYTGVPSLQLLCEEIEGALKRKDTEHVTKRLPLMLEEGKRVVSSTQQLLNTHAAATPDAGTASED